MTTQLQRAFRIFEKMNPQPGSAVDLAQWMGVPMSCAYTYIARLKALGSIVPMGGTHARPLYGLPRSEESGEVIVKRPPDDARGKWRRYAREVLNALGEELEAGDLTRP